MLLVLCAFLNGAPAAEALRIEHECESLIFATGERWRVVISAQDVVLPERTTARLRARLVAAGGKGEIWQKEQPSRPVDDQATPPWEVVVPLPEKEGVYHLEVTLVPDKSGGSDRFGMAERFGNPFRSPEPFAQRRLQLVVLGPRPSASDTPAKWREAVQFDPAQPRWRERLAALPATVRWPGSQPRSLDNGKSGTWQHQGREIVRLEPGGWQAFALPVADIGAPHALEVDYPNDVMQTLGVSIVQPGVDGQIAAAGVDTGFDVVDAPVTGPGTQTYRLTYWPRSEHTYLLLVNRRGDAPAAFGKIRVLAGPRHLPSVTPSLAMEKLRRPLAQFDEPDFFRAFGASRSRDPESRRVHDDWLTFYTGATRLDEYLRHVGYAGAVLTFTADGSALYPSDVLPPSDDSDCGITFRDGTVAERQDVAELLFRLFDRSGLRLVPKLRFSGPIPQLESLLRHAESGSGVALVGADGQTFPSAEAAGMPPISRYNPLHPRVQSVLLQAVAEVAQRYGHHRSFGGIVVDIAPGTPTHLPGLDWGRDHHTLATFRQELGTIEPVMEAAPSQWDLATQQAWVRWRAARLARLYRQMARQIRQVAPHARLMIDGAKLVDLPRLQQVTHPSLPPRLTFDQALREMGIDAQLYRDQDDVELLRMHHLQPATAGAMQWAAMTQFNRARAVDVWASPSPGGAHSFYHRSQPIRLTTFDHLNLFGQRTGPAALDPHLPPAGAANRARWIHSLAVSDAATIIDGGDVAPWGQEDTVRSLIDTMAKLPAEPFATYGDPNETSPLVVRSLARPEGTYVYVLNDSPWPANAKIQIAAPAGTRLHPVSSIQKLPPLTANPGGGFVWPLELGPYSLVAARASSTPVQITNVSVLLPSQVAADLRDRITNFQMRLAGLRERQALSVPENRDFDTLATDGTIPGWETSSVPGTRIQVDSLARFNGVASLRMESQGPAASVRSSAFPAPTTGRISLHVQLRVAQGRDVPPLQLAIEGQYRGRTYRPSAPVKIDRDAQSVASEWSQIVLPVDDLPVDGLGQLRVRFDLLGPGVVWLDEVRVSHTWFSPPEQRELSNIAALADFQLREGNFRQCLDVLDSYWPHFLTQYISVPTEVASLPRPKPSPKKGRTKPPSNKEPSALERMRRFLPKLPRIHRR